MLALSLQPEEYITINDNIVVTVSRLSRSRCFLAIEADRNIPIVRGVVLERNGNPPPTCIEDRPPLRKPKHKYGASVRWNSSREQAMLTLEKIADRLERNGDGDEARVLRAQLRQIAPDAQED